MALTPEEIDFYSRILSHSQLFHGMEEPALKAVVQTGKIAKFPPAHTLLELDQKVEGLHVILEGSAHVMKGNENLRSLGRGSFFGEISLFGASLGATARIVSHDPVTVLILTKTQIDAWSKTFPKAERSFLQKMCVELSRRLYSATDRA